MVERSLPRAGFLRRERPGVAFAQRHRGTGMSGLSATGTTSCFGAPRQDWSAAPLNLYP